MNWLNLNRKQWLLVIFLTGYSIVNLFVLGEDIRMIFNYHRAIDYNKIGYQFEGLQEYLKGQEYVGYFSEVDLRKDAASKLFAQAQYVLAPVILDPENLNHKYIILVCRQPKTAFDKIKQLNVAPLLMNERNGVILAQRP